VGIAAVVFGLKVATAIGWIPGLAH
jgi:hypothetical protein